MVGKWDVVNHEPRQNQNQKCSREGQRKDKDQHKKCNKGHTDRTQQEDRGASVGAEYGTEGFARRHTSRRDKRKIKTGESHAHIHCRGIFRGTAC